MNCPLYNALTEHIKKQPISFHVPGHKYGQIKNEEIGCFFDQILKLDATELSGLDDLHSPEGVILEAETLLSDLFQTKKSYFLVSGSTVGNLAMVMAACTEDDYVLVQRNCHKSVLNALKLAKVKPIFIEPEYDPDWKVASGVTVETVKSALRLYPNVTAIILTYPNYYGMVNDLQGIIEQAHRHRIPVLVDEAHGAHFIAGSLFPPSSVQLGADIIVQSAHKTLPAMTMSSYMHVNSEFIEADKVKEYLEIFQSSSPSYPLMASLDLAREYLAEYKEEDLQYLQTCINHFKDELSSIEGIKVLEFPNNQGDPLKMTIQSRCELSGFDLQKRLEEAGVYTELADPYNVLLVFPLLKKGQSYPLEEAVLKVKQALQDVSLRDTEEVIPMNNQKVSGLMVPYKEMSRFPDIDIPIAEAAGHVCAEAIIPYPPGIPLLLKGEQITIEKLNMLQQLQDLGARFQGGSKLKSGLIKVFKR
jgi:arginine/lysine/ornithine decarboxylase